jgi:hypothetical protein
MILSVDDIDPSSTALAPSTTGTRDALTTPGTVEGSDEGSVEGSQESGTTASMSPDRHVPRE